MSKLCVVDAGEDGDEEMCAVGGRIGLLALGWATLNRNRDDGEESLIAGLSTIL